MLVSDCVSEEKKDREVAEYDGEKPSPCSPADRQDSFQIYVSYDKIVKIQVTPAYVYERGLQRGYPSFLHPCDTHHNLIDCKPE